MSSKGWIGVDLDGTLAEYTGWQGPTHIGRPVERMKRRVDQWLAEGKDVRIFTARVSHDGTDYRMEEANEARKAIIAWTILNFGQPLRVTNVKDYSMLELWDDRAVQVLSNTGVRADGQP